MSTITLEQAVINVLEEAKGILTLHPDLFILVNKQVVRRLSEASRSLNDKESLLLSSSFTSFGLPFGEHYNRFFGGKFRGNECSKRLAERGLAEGEIVIAATAVNELNIKGGAFGEIRVSSRFFGKDPLLMPLKRIQKSLCCQHVEWDGVLRFKKRKVAG